MAEHEALVEVATARNHSEALIIAAVLRSAGIPTYIEGAQLQDEWAASRRLLGLLSGRVQVPASLRDEALRVLEEARRAGGEDGDEESDADLPESS